MLKPVNYDEQIEDLNKRIAALQDELRQAQYLKAQTGRVEFTNDQIIQGAVELLKSKIVAEDWDYDVIEKCKEKIWTEEQKRIYDELPIEASTNTFFRYVRQCRTAMENLVDDFIDVEEAAACRDFTTVK